MSWTLVPYPLILLITTFLSKMASFNEFGQTTQIGESSQSTEWMIAQWFRRNATVRLRNSKTPQTQPAVLDPTRDQPLLVEIKTTFGSTARVIFLSSNPTLTEITDQIQALSTLRIGNDLADRPEGVLDYDIESMTISWNLGDRSMEASVRCDEDVNEILPMMALRGWKDHLVVSCVQSVKPAGGNKAYLPTRPMLFPEWRTGGAEAREAPEGQGKGKGKERATSDEENTSEPSAPSVTLKIRFFPTEHWGRPGDREAEAETSRQGSEESEPPGKQFQTSAAPPFSMNPPSDDDGMPGPSAPGGGDVTGIRESQDRSRTEELAVNIADQKERQ